MPLFQSALMAMKYSARPVVGAPFGMALGGGCEVALHAGRVQAAAETYMGLVEVGVGLIPAEAVAELAVVMAGERFRYTTGDIITVDGGLAEAFPR